MKTITCKDIGGPCEMAFTTNNQEEMVNKITEHVNAMDDDAHKKTKGYMDADAGNWGKRILKKWDKTIESEGEAKKEEPKDESK